jgi:phenylpropionate dioxygenase-like ring-hydroxylating dioxygenase large terminal subunit
MSMLKNHWYVAAWATDLTDAPIGRVICDEPIVLFRDRRGAAAALEDRCPHRGLPLSLGRMIDGVLECGYHGMCYDADGRCTRAPGLPEVPQGIAARPYRCAEKWGWIWIWIGEAEKADESRIPPFPWLSDPAWVAPRGYIHINAGHELLLENLQNHMHLQFVHRKTIGTDDVSSASADVKRIGNEVHIERWLLDRPAPPLFAKAGGFSGNVDRWFNSVFIPPSSTILDIGCAATGSGAPSGDRRKGIEIRSLHAVTPETENTTHYFWAYARSFRIQDDALTETLRAGAMATFAEDLAILEAQQLNMNRFPGARLAAVDTDKAGMLVRRIRAELNEAPHGRQ